MKTKLWWREASDFYYSWFPPHKLIEKIHLAITYKKVIKSNDWDCMLEQVWAIWRGYD